MGKIKDLNHVNKTMNEDVAQSTNVATDKDAKSKLGIDSGLVYMDADAYIANPFKLLGEVFLVKSRNGNAPTSLNDENVDFEKYALPIQGIKVDEASKLKQPLLRQSIIVDKKLSASVKFLSYLEAQLNTNSYFSLMVYDQATGLLDMQDASWKNGFEQWKTENADLMQDDNIYCIFAVTGFSQKNVIRKKYIKYDGKAKGGYCGINISGELSTSTEEYSLDILFGLQPAVIKPFPSPIRNQSISQLIQEKSVHNLKRITDFLVENSLTIKNPEETEYAITQCELFNALSGSKLSKLIKEDFAVL